MAGVLEGIVLYGQSNSPGEQAQPVLSTGASAHHKMLAPLSLESGEVGSLDGTCAPQDRDVIGSGYSTTFAAFQQQDRSRNWRSVASGADFNSGETPTLLTLGETVAPSAIAYLEQFDSAARYCVLIGGQSGSDYGRIQKGTGPFNNFCGQLDAFAAASVVAGYDSCIIKAIYLQHGESRSTPYVTHMTTLLADMTTEIKARIPGQTYNPHMFLVQHHLVPEPSTAADILAAEDASDHIHVACATYHVAHNNGSYHRINTGARMLGSYLGRAHRRVIYQGQRNRRLKIISATYSRNKIYVLYEVPTSVGALVFDTSGVPAQPNMGFSFTDNSASASVVSVAPAGVDGRPAMEITLSTTPISTGKVLSYGYGDSGTDPNTAGKGNVRDSDTDMGIHGENLYNWAVRQIVPVTFSPRPVYPAGDFFLSR